MFQDVRKQIELTLQNWFTHSILRDSWIFLCHLRLERFGLGMRHIFQSIWGRLGRSVQALITAKGTPLSLGMYTRQTILTAAALISPICCSY